MSRIFISIFILFFSSFICAEDRYEAKSLEEVQAQARMLNELYESKAISKQNYQIEHERLNRITYDLTYGQLPKEMTQAENIVQTQRFDWLSTGLMILSALIGISVFFPLLKKLYYKFRVYLFLLRKLVRRYFAWLSTFVDFLLKHVGRSIKWVADVCTKMLDWLVNAPFILQEFVIYLILVPLLFLFEAMYLLVPIMLLVTIKLAHSIDHYCCKYESKKYPNVFLLVASIFWCTCAFYFSSSIMGFVAIGFINAFLGFSIGIYPGWVEFGFARHKQSYIFKTSLISLAMLLTGWLIFYSQLLPKAIGMQVYMFSAGLYFFVPLSFYTAILIISGIWFEYKKHYLAFNLYAAISGLLLLLLSYIYSMGFLFWIGAIFMVWFISSKYYELVWKKLDAVYAAAGVAVFLGSCGYYIQNNLQEIVLFMAPIL